MKETTLQIPRSVQKEGEEVIHVPEQRLSPEDRDEDHSEVGCPPAAHRGPWWSRYPPAAHGVDQVDAHNGVCGPVGNPCWSRLLTGPADPWREELMLEQVCCQDLQLRGGPTLKQPVPEGLHPVEVTHSGAVCEELQPMGRTHVGEVHGRLCPVGGIPCWSRGRK